MVLFYLLRDFTKYITFILIGHSDFLFVNNFTQVFSFVLLFLSLMLILNDNLIIITQLLQVWNWYKLHYIAVYSALNDL